MNSAVQSGAAVNTELRDATLLRLGSRRRQAAVDQRGTPTKTAAPLTEVLVVPDADLQIRAIDGWWQALFAEEFAPVFRFLCSR
jgi:hypothetical protein